MRTILRRRGASKGGASAIGASLLLWTTCLLLWLGCGGASPDIVLVTIDGARPDRLGAMGDESARTPVLDGLAAEGALFSRAFASSPLSLPSHATILTGLDPQQHGVRDDGSAMLPREIATVAERLAAEGYDTAAIIGSARLDSSHGLDRGFALYEDALPQGGELLRASLPRRSGEQVVEQAIAWLEQPRSAPGFLWVHLADLEAPRTPPAPFDELDDRYAATLSYVDTQIGRLLGAIEDRPGSLIVVAGDQGEALGENGERGHGLLASDVTLHVPIIAAGPGFEAGARSESLVTTADIAATLLAAAGVPGDVPDGSVPLAMSLAGRAPAERVAYFETLAPAQRLAWSPIRGVRDARWKYTAAPAPAVLYDTLADPSESDDRSAAEPEVAVRLQSAYQAALALDRDPGAEGLPAVGAPPPGGPGPVDPRLHVAELPAVDMAWELAASGRVSESIGVLEIIGEDWPALRVRALEVLATVCRAAGLDERALAAYREWLDITGSTEARIGLAATLTSQGRYAESVAALEGGPNHDPRIRVARGEALRLLEREDEALAEAEAVLAISPDHDGALALASLARAGRDGAIDEVDTLEALLRASANPGRLVQTRAVLAQLLTEQRRYEEAARVLTAFPGAPSRHLAMLARIMSEHGRNERATELYEAALVARPTDAEYRQALADLYSAAGRYRDAGAVYDALISVSPEDPGLYVDRGAVRHITRDLPGAEADYRKALTLNENLPEVHYNLALIAQTAGREDEAIAHLQNAVAFRPEYSKAHLMLARIYGEHDDPRSAFHAEQAVVSDPKSFEGKDPRS